MAIEFIDLPIKNALFSIVNCKRLSEGNPIAYHRITQDTLDEAHNDAQQMVLDRLKKKVTLKMGHEKLRF